MAVREGGSQYKLTIIKQSKAQKDVWTDRFVPFHYFVNGKNTHTVQNSKGYKRVRMKNFSSTFLLQK